MLDSCRFLSKYTFQTLLTYFVPKDPSIIYGLHHTLCFAFWLLIGLHHGRCGRRLDKDGDIGDCIPSDSSLQSCCGAGAIKGHDTRWEAHCNSHRTCWTSVTTPFLCPFWTKSGNGFLHFINPGCVTISCEFFLTSLHSYKAPLQKIPFNEPF